MQTLIDIKKRTPSRNLHALNAKCFESITVNGKKSENSIRTPCRLGFGLGSLR